MIYGSFTEFVFLLAVIPEAVVDAIEGWDAALRSLSVETRTATPQHGAWCRARLEVAHDYEQLCVCVCVCVCVNMGPGVH